MNQKYRSISRPALTHLKSARAGVHHGICAARTDAGFTLIELVLVIVLLAIVSVTAVIKWPSGLDRQAAAREMKRAIRYAQHMAMTREYDTSTNRPWGMTISLVDNQYTVERSDHSERAGVEFTARNLLGKASYTISGNDIFFNGLGEPINANGEPLAIATTYTVSGTLDLNVCPETGYVLQDQLCP